VRVCTRPWQGRWGSATQCVRQVATPFCTPTDSASHDTLRSRRRPWAAPPPPTNSNATRPHHTQHTPVGGHSYQQFSSLVVVISGSVLAAAWPPSAPQQVRQKGAAGRGKGQVESRRTRWRNSSAQLLRCHSYSITDVRILLHLGWCTVAAWWQHQPAPRTPRGMTACVAVWCVCHLSRHATHHHCHRGHGCRCRHIASRAISAASARSGHAPPSRRAIHSHTRAAAAAVSEGART